MHSSKMMGHRPRKRFGQHFLHDQAVINRIVHAIRPNSDDRMIEIGPGLGALTYPLMETVKRLTAIEIDRDLHAALSALPQDQLTLIHADALSFDYGKLGHALRLVGNLPYNISTPLILHLLCYTHAITDMHFMLQKEVVSRLAAQPGGKAFGRLSVMVQYHCEVEYLFDVPPQAFTPPPKVESAIVRLIPYQKSPYPEVDQNIFETLVTRAFSMRRKTLANNLKPLLSASAIESLAINPQFRPEQLTMIDYVKLAKLLDNHSPL